MKKLTLNPEHTPCVVPEFKEFVEGVDLEKYERLVVNDGRVFVKMFEDKPGENSSSGGIILNDEKSERQEIGVVVAAGEGAYNPYKDCHVANPYKAGDVVFVPEHMGHDFAFGSDRELLKSMLVSDVLARL